MAEKSATGNSPAILLPKGGGATQGIGESFKPDLFTGTGNFGIPVFTSPGRSGIGPQLALQYSSGSGNGPFDDDQALNHCRRVASRENVISINGRSPGARVADSKKPLHIFEWLIEETFDVLGFVAGTAMMGKAGADTSRSVLGRGPAALNQMRAASQADSLGPPPGSFRLRNMM
jgi:hypothetical protein